MVVRRFGDRGPEEARKRGGPLTIRVAPGGPSTFKLCMSSMHQRHMRCSSLSPPDFSTIITSIYGSLGSPPVSRKSCWDVYLALLTGLRQLDALYNTPVALDEKWGHTLTMAQDESPDGMELLPDLRPLRNGDNVVGAGGYYYMGGVNNGAGLSKSLVILSS